MKLSAVAAKSHTGRWYLPTYLCKCLGRHDVCCVPTYGIPCRDYTNEHEPTYLTQLPLLPWSKNNFKEQVSTCHDERYATNKYQSW